MKRCTKCRELKSIDSFYKNGSRYRPDCKDCKKSLVQTYRTSNPDTVQNAKKESYRKNKEKISRLRKIKYLSNKVEINQKRREKYSNNPEDHKKESIRYYYNNREKCLKRQKKLSKRHYVNNKSLYNAKAAKRRAQKINATPRWANTDKIKLLYEKAKWLESVTGLQYEVDHIIPLQNDKVCGLHVWENLQILETELNKSKGNKYKD